MRAHEETHSQTLVGTKANGRKKGRNGFMSQRVQETIEHRPLDKLSILIEARLKLHSQMLHGSLHEVFCIRVMEA